jgi:two-component system, chemotaxis family, chemotaxis protein CheY
MSFPSKILLTDDEPHVRKYVSLLLRLLGPTTIIEAVNGEDAIAKYHQEKPDLVFLDVNMPTMDGVQALRHLSQIDPEVIVIMLTSMTTRQIVEECVELGAVGYIRKDTPKDELMAELRRIINECFEQEAPTI